jgi:hypothetical protein
MDVSSTDAAEGLAESLAESLRSVDHSPNAGAARLRAAVLANRLALASRDAFHADVAEALAAEVAPGATRSLVEALREQGELARTIRRAIAAGEPLHHPSLPREAAGAVAGA